MTLQLDDTIAAIASPRGAGLRGILRISGNDSLRIAQLVCGDDIPANLYRAAAIPASLPLAEVSTPLSITLLVWPTNRSFTGQPSVEVHLPGCLPLVNEVLRRFLAAGARAAEPGEFTLRAFLAGRIDLLQAEAVLGVIDAANIHELRAALGQLAGGISHPIASLHEDLLLQVADLEAGLDFAEEDLEFLSREACAARLREGTITLEQLLQQSASRMAGGTRQRVVLAGPPNAGKSTLFNALTGGNGALVSASPGTTRDYLCATVTEGDFAWDLIDTAGCETPRDGIEQSAAQLRDEQLARADLVVWCEEFSAEASAQKSVTPLEHLSQPILRIHTKCDLAGSGALANGELRISAATGAGMPEFKQAILQRLSTDAGGSEIIAATAARCADSLQQARDALGRCLALLANGDGDELLAWELRSVIDSLGRIVGRIHTDDILDRIFSRFCIGK